MSSKKTKAELETELSAVKTRASFYETQCEEARKASAATMLKDWTRGLADDVSVSIDKDKATFTKYGVTLTMTVDRVLCMGLLTVLGMLKPVCRVPVIKAGGNKDCVYMVKFDMPNDSSWTPAK